MLKFVDPACCVLQKLFVLYNLLGTECNFFARMLTDKAFSSYWLHLRTTHSKMTAAPSFINPSSFSLIFPFTSSLHIASKFLPSSTTFKAPATMLTTDDASLRFSLARFKKLERKEWKPWCPWMSSVVCTDRVMCWKISSRNFYNESDCGITST